MFPVEDRPVAGTYHVMTRQRPQENTGKGVHGRIAEDRVSRQTSDTRVVVFFESGKLVRCSVPKRRATEAIVAVGCAES